MRALLGGHVGDRIRYGHPHVGIFPAYPTARFLSIVNLHMDLC